MTNTHPRPILRALGALTIGAALASTMLVPAEAKAPKGLKPAAVKAMTKANKVCAPVEGETQFEYCVVGAFGQATGQLLKGRDYTVDYGRKPGQEIRLVNHWKKYWLKKGYKPVSEDLGDALAEGGSKDDTSRNWTLCVVKFGDTTYVRCPDGKVVTS